MMSATGDKGACERTYPVAEARNAIPDPVPTSQRLILSSLVRHSCLVNALFNCESFKRNRAQPSDLAALVSCNARHVALHGVNCAASNRFNLLEMINVVPCKVHRDVAHRFDAAFGMHSEHLPFR